MIKIILLLLISINLYSKTINEFVTDIWFGNGVWNTKKMAKDSLKELKLENQLFPYKNLNFELAYNWTGASKSKETVDYLYDVIETFYFLKERGQIKSDVTLFTYLTSALTSKKKFAKLFTIRSINLYFQEAKELQKKLLYTTNGNIDEMLSDYRKLSLDKGHRVLGIAHSEGNFYMNAVFSKLTDKEKKYFRMIGVGVPADNIRGYKQNEKNDKDQLPPYITLQCDQVISYLPNILDLNTNCIELEKHSDIYGHLFYDSYLKQPGSLENLKELIKQEMTHLNKEPSIWELESRPCLYTGIMATDENKENPIKIDYVFDFNGKVFSMEDKLIKSKEFSDKNLSFKDNIVTLYVENNNTKEISIINETIVGYLTTIEVKRNKHYEHTILRTSVPAINRNLHYENKLFFTEQIEDSLYSNLIYKQKQIKFYQYDFLSLPDQYNIGIDIGQFKYLNVDNGILTYENNEINLKSVEFQDGATSTNGEDSYVELHDISIATIKPIYKEADFDSHGYKYTEYQVNYCYQ
jgi:hypothetical protein